MENFFTNQTVVSEATVATNQIKTQSMRKGLEHYVYFLIWRLLLCKEFYKKWYFTEDKKASQFVSFLPAANPLFWYNSFLFLACMKIIDISLQFLTI